MRVIRTGLHQKTAPQNDSVRKWLPSQSQYVLQRPSQGKREQSESDEVSFEKLREYFQNCTNF